MTPSPRGGLSLVVPVFDEEVRVREFGPTLLAFASTSSTPTEIVFVDDGSSDRTVEELTALLDGAPGLGRVLQRPHRGKGAAVAAGLASSTRAFAGFCDLDLSTPLPELEKVIARAREIDGLAIGSRDLAGSTIPEPESRLRELLGRTYNRLLQLTVTPGVVDTQCGAKVARREVWARVLPHARQEGFAWDAEIVAVALAMGIPVQEVPIEWRHDQRSKVHVGRDGLAMVLETPRIWRTARHAAGTRPPAAPAPHPAAPSGDVFEGAHAHRLIAADRSHWWFRSKAAFVSTALSRTGRAQGVLLDVGAGAGGVTAMVGWDPGRSVVVEAGRELVTAARSRNGLPAAQGRAERLPVSDASVDVVCLLDVLEHLSEPDAALRDIGRVLRPGGRLVVNVPAHAWLWSSADEHLHHHRRYDRAVLRADLQRCGFEPVLLSHTFSWLVLPVWLVRRFGRDRHAALGLDRTSLALDRAAMILTALERWLLGRSSLPFGTSLLCVATKPGD